MKKINKIAFVFIVFLTFFFSCSTKKDKFLNRNFQALNTKYNVLFNGQMAYEEAKIALDKTHVDNFWTILPIEPLKFKKENTLNSTENNTSLFQLAEKKAADAIQKRSMLISGVERNYQMDEVYMLLGKARYYDQRFIPSLDAFNYILYKHPTSNGLQEAAIWKEKINVRLENDEFAINNLKKILLELKEKKELYVDAQATISQGFINLEDYYCALDHLKEALSHTKKNEEKGRYNFILGQLYEKVRYQDSAKMCYQEVLKLNRKIDRKYRIQSIINLSKLDKFNNRDTIAFVKKWNKLFEDRENRPYMDYLIHHKANAYKNAKDTEKAIIHYNISLKTPTTDDYLTASNYREIANIYYDEYIYSKAGKYYDSTLVKLEPKTPEHRKIKKRKEELEDFIKYEEIAIKNDSILSLIAMNNEERIAYFKDYILLLKEKNLKKAEDQSKAKQEFKDNSQLPINQSKVSNSIMPPDDEFIVTKKPEIKNNSSESTKAPNNSFASSSNGFYFYNLNSVSKGKLEFKRKWGNRKKGDNWRINSDISSINTIVDDKINTTTVDNNENPANNPEFYISQIPTDKDKINLLKIERDFAQYQISLLYKERFKVDHLALNSFEKLISFNPEKRLELPSMFHLYELYSNKNDGKADYWKNKILSQYPDSRYALIINKDKNINKEIIDPEKTYKIIYETMEKGEIRNALMMCEKELNNLIGESIYPKLELLRATLIGKISGINEYKKELNYVALNYANLSEGKEAENILKTDVIAMEAKNFTKEEKSKWNIIIPISKDIDKEEKKLLIEKLNKYIVTRVNQNRKLTEYEYDFKINFLILHSFSGEFEAKTDISVLREYKDYLIKNEIIAINSANLEVIQIKKNLEEYKKI